jgi:hypothetical protein
MIRTGAAQWPGGPDPAGSGTGFERVSSIFEGRSGGRRSAGDRLKGREECARRVFFGAPERRFIAKSLRSTWRAPSLE